VQSGAPNTPPAPPRGIVVAAAAAAIVVSLAGCGTGAGLEWAAAEDLRAERAEWRGDRSGVVHLRRHVRVEVGSAADPANATSRITILTAVARFGGHEGATPEAVVMHVPETARLALLEARVVSPEGVTPVEASSVASEDRPTRVDPATKAWVARFDPLPAGHVLEVMGTFEIAGTLRSDARVLGAEGAPTAELFLRYEMPTHVRGDVQLPRGLTRPVVTEKDGRTVIAALLRTLPPDGERRDVARYVTRRAAPRNYKQAFVTDWDAVARPYEDVLVTGSLRLRQEHVAPVKPEGTGADAVRELTLWARDRIQREDAADAPWDEARNLPPLLRVNDLNATDKVHLLHWLLDDAKIPHRVAIARRARWPELAPGFAAPGTFDAPLLHVTELDLWLDPVCQECEPGQVRPDLRGRQALLLGGDAKLATLPAE
jgi:hypothetical protein